MSVYWYHGRVWKFAHKTDLEVTRAPHRFKIAKNPIQTQFGRGPSVMSTNGRRTRCCLSMLHLKSDSRCVLIPVSNISADANVEQKADVVRVSPAP